MIKHIVIRSIFALLILALLVGGGYALYRAGVSQGYQVAVQSTDKGVVPVTPPGNIMPWGHAGRPYMMMPFFGLFMPCLGILALFFIFWLVTLPFRIARRAMCFHAWRHADKADWEAWAKDHEHHHGYMHGPWGRRWQTQPENKDKPENAAEGESKS